MKINGTIFSKPQQDQLKRGIGTELDKVVTKVDDVDARMLNYMGNWASGNEYHENDVVTWAQDGHLYEVIKEHTSSSTIDPSSTEYYKAMTARKYVVETKQSNFKNFINSIDRKNVVDIQVNAGSIISAMFMGNTKEHLISFWDANYGLTEPANITFSIIIMHVLDDSIVGKSFNFDINGGVTKHSLNPIDSITVTFVQ